MSDKRQSRKILSNTFNRGMWKDSLPSLQPKGTWRGAWSAVRQSDMESFYGLSNEPSNALDVTIDGNVRALLHIEERDQFLVFVNGKDKSEIGLIDKIKSTYRKLTDFPLDNCEFNDIQYKVFKECKELHIYFSSGNTYYTLNVDDPCCEFKVEELLSCDSGSLVRASVVSGGNVQNGSYKFFYQLVDNGGNATNFFTINNPVFVGEGDNIPGESSGKAIQLDFEIFSNKYPIARIGVIRNNGQRTVEIIGETGVSNGLNSFLYTGSEETTPIQLSQVLARKDYYIKGQNLVQFQNRLILYNLLPKFNLNYQTIANSIRVKYINYAVPIELAHLYQGLRPNEKYWFGIRFNYCDNTFSSVFDIPGLEAGVGSDVNCDDCPIPFWKKTDTSVREELYLQDVDSIQSEFQRVNKFETNIDVSTEYEIIPKEDGISIRAADDGALVLDCHVGRCDENEDFPCEECVKDEYLDVVNDEIESSFIEARERLGTRIDEINYIKTIYSCDKDGSKYTVGDSCYECREGYWHYANNGVFYNNEYDVSTDRSVSGIDLSQYEPEKIYAEDGCTVLEVIPKRYSKGSFGYYETTETYPMTQDSDCNLLYGDLAGKNVRLHVVPSRAKEPNFASFTSGVPTRDNPANEEFKDTYVFMIGIEVENIIIPTDLPKPLDADNPYTIMMVERKPGDTSVIGSGVLVSTMKGVMDGVEYSIPKNGLNGPEFFDGHINPLGQSTFRGGFTNDTASYVVHSPDFSLYEPDITADWCIFEQEVHGTGYRHGLYEEGEDPDSLFLSKENNFGARSSYSLNKRIPLEGEYECIKAMSYAPADSVVASGGLFTTPLLNYKRESSVYLELDRDGFVPFTRDSYVEYGGGNGAVGVGLFRDGATDDSFIGDTMDHECPVHNVRGHDVTFVKDIPNQYGSPINQVYIPLLHGKSSGLVGDSFVNQYHYKRTSLISDKTPKDIAKPFISPVELNLDFLDAFDIRIFLQAVQYTVLGITFGFPGIDIRPLRNVIPLLKWYLRILIINFFTIIGYEKCGSVPDSGDLCSKINHSGGLRGNNPFTIQDIISPGCVDEDYDGFCFGSIGGPLPAPANRGNTDTPDDSYYPHVHKGTLATIQNSNVNHYYRQTGEVVLGDDGIAEVHNKRLKSLRLDSSFNEGGNWKDSYLNRFYVLRKQPPTIKLIARVVLNVILTVIFPSIFIFTGLMNIIDAVTALYIGAGVVVETNLFGILFGIILNLILIRGGIWLHQLFSLTNLDNRLIDNLLRIKSCLPDKKFTDGTYGIKNGRIKQFEDNYYRYDLVYSDKTYEEVGYGAGVVYNTSKCKTPISKFVYSNPQVNDSPIDYWRSFNVNDYQELPSEYGQITKIFNLSDSLFIHTTDMILDLLTGRRSLELDQGSILLGSGNLFSRAVPIYGGITEGYAGLLDPNSTISTRLGYIFPDRKAKRLYIFNGQSVKPISDLGLQGEFQRNFDFKLLEQFPGYSLVDTKGNNSIGYSIGMDNEHERILFTKVDYEAIDPDSLVCREGILYDKDGSKISLSDTSRFINKSFTYSYDINENVWISNHYYTPQLYAWDRFNFYSFNNKGLYKHNIEGSFGEFYGEFYEHVIELSITDTDYRKAFEFINSKLDTEAYKYVEGEYLEYPKLTFDKLVAWNSHQSSGELTLVDSKNTNIIDSMVEYPDKVTIDFTFNGYNLNNLNDRLIRFEDFKFNRPIEVGPEPVNDSNISSDIKNNKFMDNYLEIRLIFSKFEDIKLFTKVLSTRVDLQHD